MLLYCFNRCVALAEEGTLLHVSGQGIKKLIRAIHKVQFPEYNTLSKLFVCVCVLFFVLILISPMSYYIQSAHFLRMLLTQMDSAAIM